MKINVKISKLEDRAKVPTYGTNCSSGFDFYSIDTITIPAGGTMKIRTGIQMDIPNGYEVQIRPRSGLSAKSKVRIANSPGTIDSDYTREILIIVDNISQNQADSYRVNAGDRIAQGVLVPVIQADFEEVEDILDTGRGGLGSTGV